MDQKVIYVVGDPFAEMKRLGNIITVSDLKKQLAEGSTLDEEISYVMAQGADRVNEGGFLKFITADTTQSRPLASSLATHKHKSHNILISAPQKVSDVLYRSNVLIDGNCAEISDHSTGLHVQGMVIMEAARQMVTAVTEDHIFPAESRGSYFFVLNQMDANFHRFAFPFAMHIDCRLDRCELDERGNYSCDYVMDVIQNGQSTATIRIVFKCYDKSLIARKEEKMAAQTLESLLAEDTRRLADQYQPSQLEPA
ncbi:AfsA-related hotdog domain-containing protein [Hahella ganghwensis]|uniref:AfsA-related hotdog domain-containing protein n=1 Tax=Hahella ganghwensis TaxID=286420 RepID=UPI00037E0BF5|nr:AfsA-related hotdog domain-containing protein [Hahella ganghwensis]